MLSTRHMQGLGFIVGFQVPKPPKVCKIVAPNPIIMAIKAIILHTFGVQVLTINESGV